MRIRIFGEFEARGHLPERPTYAIRIHNSRVLQADSTQLIDSPNYRVIRDYTFDDCDPSYVHPGDLMFEDSLADRLIREFIEGRRGCEEFLVHCSRGQNRSPAVAIALNEAFNLGEDGSDLRRRFPHMTKYIYKKLIEASRRLK